MDLDYKQLSLTLSGRHPPARLIAVSKGQSPEKIRALYHLGQREFGENYADELALKAEALRDLQIKWIFIGHLQSNKIQRLVNITSEIQTISSMKHARYVARYSADLGKKNFPIFIEVNAADESAKAGVSPAATPALAKEIQTEFPGLDLRGIMTVPPDIYNDSAFPPESLLPELYLQLKTLAAKVGQGELSLGMSNDLHLALRAGSTCVRIGRALFGARTLTT